MNKNAMAPRGAEPWVEMRVVPGAVKLRPGYSGSRGAVAVSAVSGWISWTHSCSEAHSVA